MIIIFVYMCNLVYDLIFVYYKRMKHTSFWIVVRKEQYQDTPRGIYLNKEYN